MNQKSAVTKINNNGVLLVFSINNQKEPASLWSEFFPRSKMRWEWDETGDNRVGELWGLMKRLSDSRQVVYSKWYQGRATFFSRKLFVALLCLEQQNFESTAELSRNARDLLECLESDSPLSTKQLKKLTDLRGKDNEKFYNRGMKQLFSKFLIVAFGEVDDGAFPSLAVGATKHLYEDLWLEAQSMQPEAAQILVDRYLPAGSLFRKYLDKQRELAPNKGKDTLKDTLNVIASSKEFR
ncbi:MAG: hypothetical protein H7061_10070 [Bdellovibrionaceae bacterium]|nr:hypothetical protein [Bdellovibrio sp.]